MEVKLHPPDGATSPWTDRWYTLNAMEVKSDLSATINEHPITDKDTFLFSQYLHPTSRIIIDCILTSGSDIQGSGVEDKKDNLIDAAATWWTVGDAKTRTDCARIYYRGWAQYVIIERLGIDKMSGDDTEYIYTLECIIHEGQTS